ncbi:MAG: 4-hydroxy-tetrahydrodipicolinate synthase [Oscillospiraceae bacterium]|nr:4-hydroxy-tetrahydrodipicolinate synthase [Oscillospiraceae bacterium]
MKQPIFTGSGVAIVTPFTRDTVDYPALRRLLDFQLENGTDAVIVCGTTGEAATMSYVERMRTIETVVRHVDGRVPVIAGSGSNNTENAITLSKDAALAGVDGLLVVTPFYNKATQRGLIRHYTAIADVVDRPLILYNVPSRTGVKCTAETYATLAKHPNIVGVKEASGDLALIQKTRELCPEDFTIWSGNDDETASIMLFGGKGVISVAANVAPREMRELTAACLTGDFAAAGRMQLRLRKLCEALFWEVNPIPVKTALALMGYCQEVFRLPLCEMEPENREKLKEVLAEYQVL